MKATQATPTKLSRRSRSGRWEDALLFVDEEEGAGEEGLSPAPEGAAICCRVFISGGTVGAAAGGKGERDQHRRKILGLGCVGRGVREGGGQSWGRRGVVSRNRTIACLNNAANKQGELRGRGRRGKPISFEKKLAMVMNEGER